MSDLISRKEAIEIIQNLCVDGKMYGNDDMTLIDAYDAIDGISEFPTAYDVDEAVEQIEKLPHRKLNLGDAMMDIMQSGKTDRHFVCLEDVIEIVKGAVKE